MKVNKISLKQMGGPTQNQPVDPAVQQIIEFISDSIDDGQDPVAIIMGLVDQEVDQQTIAQAFMTVGYEQDEVISLFEEVEKQMQPPVPASPEQQTRDPQEIARNQTLEAEAQAVGAQEDQAVLSQQNDMSQAPMGKSGIEIKPENRGKFTAWAKARGMSVSEAANMVMSNPDNYPPSVVKMANFAKNAAGWKKEEGGEFSPHLMYKDNNTQKAETYAEHLKLKELGYLYEAQPGVEIPKNNWTFGTQNYIDPLAFQSEKKFNVGDAMKDLGKNYNNFFSTDVDESGSRKGVVMDWKRKQKAHDKDYGYFDYDLRIDENDPNTYGFTDTDLYNLAKNPTEAGKQTSLRTDKVFQDDIEKYSMFNWNSKTNEYDTILSDREIDMDIYGKNKNRDGTTKTGLFARGEHGALSNERGETGENWDYFNNLDTKTKDEIIDFNDNNQGERFDVDEFGKASWKDPDEVTDIDYRESMMGYNPVLKYGGSSDTSAMIPTLNGQPSAGMINKSSLPKAQFANQPGGGALSFKDWVMANPMSRSGANAQQDYQAYVKQGNFTNQQGNFLNPSGNPQTPPPYSNQLTNFTSPNPGLGQKPTSTITNNVMGTLDKAWDDPTVDLIGASANALYDGATHVNNMFEDWGVEQAQKDLYNNSVADNVFGVNEKDDRGVHPINGGPMYSEMDRTPILNMTARKGKEINNKEDIIDIDSITLAKLIAAGADIEIL